MFNSNKAICSLVIVCLFLSYAGFAQSDPETVVKKFYDLIDTQQISEYGKLFSEDCEIYFASSKEPKLFKDVIPFIREHYKAFPDYRHIVEHMHSDQEYVTVIVRYTGTHMDDFFELKASGKKLDYRGIFVFRVIDQKIISVWGIEDDLGLREQLEIEN
jgi:predicted ester cyclase